MHTGDIITLVPHEPSLSFSFTDKREADQAHENANITSEDADTQDVEDEGQNAAADDSQPAAASGIDAQITCGICLGILFKCVTLVPCMHSFCGPCMREWSDARGRVQCPQCRAFASHVR